MSRSSLRVALAAGCFVFTVWPRPAGAGDDEGFGSWLSQTLAHFEASPPARAVQRELEQARSALRESLEESPWTVEASAGQAVLSPNPDEEEAMLFGRERARSDLGGTVTLRTRSGWEASLDASTSYGRQQLGGDSFGHQVQLTLAYDLTRGGTDGPAKTIERINASRATRSLHGFRQRLVDLQVELQGLLTDVYVTECRLRRLEDLRGAVAETVETGKLLLDTKTISYKDYLNFVDLDNAFRRRIVGLESEQRALVERLERWGPRVVAATRELREQEPDCAPDVSAVIDRADSLDLARRRREEVAGGLPSVTAASAAVTTAKLDLHLERQDQKPSVVVFLQTEVSRVPPVDRTLGSITAGMSFSWEVAGARGDLAIQTDRKALLAADARREEVLVDNVTRINTLIAENHSQKDVFAVIEKSLDTSRELLKVLDAERSIGLVDSLSYTNAVLNAVDAELELLQRWAILEKNSFELELYVAYVDRSSYRPANAQ